MGVGLVTQQTLPIACESCGALLQGAAYQHPDGSITCCSACGSTKGCHCNQPPGSADAFSAWLDTTFTEEATSSAATEPPAASSWEAAPGVAAASPPNPRHAS